MIVTSEYVFNNPKLDERSDIVNNTECGYIEKYRYDCDRKVEVICDVEFFDNITKKLRNVRINHYY